MDNQQERLLCWLGGIMDGESSIGASYHLVKKTQKFTIITVMSIAMGHKPTIERIYGIIKGLDITANMYRQPGKGNQKEYWVIRCTGLTSLNKLLKIMKPYIFTKSAQVDLMLAYTDARLKTIGKSRSSPYTTSEIAIVEELRALNTPRKRILRDFTPRLPIKNDWLQDKVQA